MNEPIRPISDGKLLQTGGSHVSPLAGAAIGAAVYYGVHFKRQRDQKAFTSEWQQWREIREQQHLEFVQFTFARLIAEGHNEEMATAEAIHIANTDPAIAKERQFYNLPPIEPDPNWVEQMAARRRAEAPPPMPTQPDIAAIKRVLMPPPNVREAVSSVPPPE